MQEKESSNNFWKGLSLILIALVLFLAIADVSVSPRFMSSSNEAETTETTETRQTQQAPQSQGGMVGGC